MAVLSASSPSRSDPPHDGSLAGPVHRAPRKREAVSVFEGGWYATSRKGLQGKRVRRMLLVPERGTRRRSMQAWLPMVALKSVVLCQRPPNHAFEGSAQQRARCWVPSSLRSSAPPQRNRSASRSNVAAS